MATVQHSALTGDELHECKGAASATSGQVPVATGTGSAVFATLAYSQLSGRPSIPTLSYNDVTASGIGLVKTYTTTASSGVWSVDIAGFTTVHNVIPVALSTGTALGTAAIATLGTYDTDTVTGSVIIPGSAGSALGGSQTVIITVIGV